MPLRHRHGYHAALHRGLPAGTTSPAQEFSLRDEGARRTAPGPDPPGSSRSVIKGRMTPVPLVLLSVMLPDPHHLAVLARPGPVGAACHPPRHLPVQAAPSFLTPAASGARAKVSHLHSNHSASRRTVVFTDTPITMLQAESQHRGHAIIEQVHADLRAGALGASALRSFSGQRRLVAVRGDGVQPHPRRRGAGRRAAHQGHHRVSACAPDQRPGRIATSARRPTLHLPRDWPWETGWQQHFDTVTTGPPTATAA